MQISKKRTHFLQMLRRGAMLSLALLAVHATATTGLDARTRWVTSWGSAQMVPETQNLLPAEDWRNTSLRQIVRLSIGGERIRVRITNAFGTTPLIVESASVARPLNVGTADVVNATVRPLLFDGKQSVMIPAGAEYYSDPVSITVAPRSDLAISLHFKGEPVRQTGHAGSRMTSFIVPGNRVLDAEWQSPKKIERWYQITDVDVEAPRSVGATVLVGDSIIDGFGVKADTHLRWTDHFSERLRAAGIAMGVVNAGIGGGRMLRDGLGPNLVARFERDVLGRSGVTHAVVLIGVNDFGSQRRNGDDTPEARAKLLADLKLAFRQIATRARNNDIKLIGATILPYIGSDYYRPTADNDADRQALNDWIRASGVFDGVIDFDAGLRDPSNPSRLANAYDSGDGLHPSMDGYRRMADVVPLSLFSSLSISQQRTMNYKNPILSGFHADPSACRMGEDYYLVTSSFEYFPGVPVYHSRDLVNWRQIGHALTRESQLPLKNQKASKGIFAPTIRCDEKTRTFYMVTTNIENGGNFFVHTKDPAGEWSEPVWIKEKAWGMDPSLFFDDDGKVYYTRHGGGRNGGVYQAEIDIASGQLKDDAKLIWPGTGGIWPEGPHLYKINGWYYLLISEGGTSYDHMLTMARSRDPWGPFEPDPSNPIFTHRHLPQNPIQALGHADLLQTPQGDWWLVMLGIRPLDRHHHLGRETFLAPASWSADGWLRVNGGQPLGLEMTARGLPAPQPWPALPVRDEFNGTKLTSHWVHLRTRTSELWSLTEKPGVLRLRGSSASLNDDASPAFVARSQDHFRARIATELSFTPTQESHEAGLVLRQNELNHYTLRIVGAKKRQVELVTRVKGETTVVGRVTVLGSQFAPVGLHIDSTPDRYEFSVTFADGTRSVVGSAPTQPLSTEKAGGFTGVYVGMYAAGAKNGELTPPADFAWFDYESKD